MHFLVLGALLYGLYVGFADDNVVEAEATTIRITGADINSLAEGWRRTWQRSPTADELVGMVEALLEEEVLYREALTLGLDRDDTIVRRRLRQKIEFLAEDLVQIAAPGDEALQAYLDGKIERYRIPPSLNFTHVYVNPERHGDGFDAVIAETLFELRAGTAPDLLGDPFLLPMTYLGEPLDRLAQNWGEMFALEVSEQEMGKWVGPLTSSYGLHLVRVDDLAEGYVPNLDTIRERVERDWYAENREVARDEFFRELAAKYDVEIVWPDGFTPPREVTGWQP